MKISAAIAKSSLSSQLLILQLPDLLELGNSLHDFLFHALFHVFVGAALGHVFQERLSLLDLDHDLVEEVLELVVLLGLCLGEGGRLR